MTKEQEECIAKMRAVSAIFYSGAQRTGCHAYIEFTGLMNEFINICEDNAKKGVDFMMANTHSDIRMKLASYRVNYMKEKLSCIFEGFEVKSVEEFKKHIDSSVKHGE